VDGLTAAEDELFKADRRWYWRSDLGIASWRRERMCMHIDRSRKGRGS
jgi:hypothetical protein